MEVLSLVLKCKSTYKTSNSFLLICFQCWFVEAFRSFLTCSHAIAFGSLISEGVTLQLYTELSALKKRNFVIQVSLKSLQHIPIMTISLFQNVNWACIRSSQDVYVLRPCQFNIFELNPANTSTSNQRWSSTFINVVSTYILVENESWADVCFSISLQSWNKVFFSTLICGYHIFTSIVICQQSWFWCQLKFVVVSTLTSALNQRWQYGVDLTLISHRPTSRRYFNIYQRWNNVVCLLGKFCFKDTEKIKSNTYNSLSRIFLSNQRIKKNL